MLNYWIDSTLHLSNSVPLDNPLAPPTTKYPSDYSAKKCTVEVVKGYVVHSIRLAEVIYNESRQW